MAEARFYTGPRPAIERSRESNACITAAGRGNLRPVVFGDEELLRHQGIQFLGSLRVVRRSPQRPDGGWPAVRNAMVGVIAIAHRRCRGDAEEAHGDRSLRGQDRRQGGDADACSTRRLSETCRVEGRLLAERKRVARDAGWTLTPFKLSDQLQT